MRSKNICKFITSGGEERLSSVNFVLESNKEAMLNENKLKNHALYLVSSGDGKFFIGEKTFFASPGTLIFAFEGECVRTSPDIGFEYMYIGFEGGRALDLFSRFNISSAERVFSGFEGLIPFWRDSLSRATDENIDLVSECALIYTFSKLTEHKNRDGEIVTKLVRRIDDDFSDPNLSLSSLADELGYNVKYLSHSFKEKTGMGFSQYLRTVRIKHAVLLMDHGVDSVKNIAFLCGFTDPLYFSTVFKESIGSSPKEYISQMKNKDSE